MRIHKTERKEGLLLFQVLMHQAHLGRGKRRGTGNQGRYSKEEDRRRLKQTAGNQVRQHHASGRQCAEPSLDRERARCA